MLRSIIDTSLAWIKNNKVWHVRVEALEKGKALTELKAKIDALQDKTDAVSRLEARIHTIDEMLMALALQELLPNLKKGESTGSEGLKDAFAKVVDMADLEKNPGIPAKGLLEKARKIIEDYKAYEQAKALGKGKEAAAETALLSARLRLLELNRGITAVDEKIINLLLTDELQDEFTALMAKVAEGKAPFVKEEMESQLILKQLKGNIQEAEQDRQLFSLHTFGVEREGKLAALDKKITALTQEYEHKEVLLSWKIRRAQKIMEALDTKDNFAGQRGLKDELIEINEIIEALGGEEKADHFAPDPAENRERAGKLAISEIDYKIRELESRQGGLTGKETGLTKTLRAIREWQNEDRSKARTFSEVGKFIDDETLFNRVVKTLGGQDKVVEAITGQYYSWISTFVSQTKAKLGKEPPLVVIGDEGLFFQWLAGEFPQVHPQFDLKQLSLYKEVEDAAREMYDIMPHRAVPAEPVTEKEIVGEAGNAMENTNVKMTDSEPDGSKVSLRPFANVIFDPNQGFDKAGAGIKLSARLDDVWARLTKTHGEAATNQQMQQLMNDVARMYKELFVKVEPLMLALENVMKEQAQLKPMAGVSDLEYLRQELKLKQAQERLARELGKSGVRAELVDLDDLDKVFNTVLDMIEAKIGEALAGRALITGIESQYKTGWLAQTFIHLSIGYSMKWAGGSTFESMPINLVLRVVLWDGAEALKEEFNEQQLSWFAEWKNVVIKNMDSMIGEAESQGSRWNVLTLQRLRDRLQRALPELELRKDGLVVAPAVTQDPVGGRAGVAQKSSKDNRRPQEDKTDQYKQNDLKIPFTPVISPDFLRAKPEEAKAKSIDAVGPDMPLGDILDMVRRIPFDWGNETLNEKILDSIIHNTSAYKETYREAGQFLMTYLKVWPGTWTTEKVLEAYKKTILEKSGNAFNKESAEHLISDLFMARRNYVDGWLRKLLDRSQIIDMELAAQKDAGNKEALRREQAEIQEMLGLIIQ
ncbi:MAG: hypothetical protein AAB356_07225, partial [Deltaproteobacteria bacterium]